MAYAGYVCAVPCPGRRFFRGSSSDELQTPVTARAAVLGMQRKLTLTFPPCGLKTAGAALWQVARARSCPQKSQSLSARLIAGKERWQEGGYQPLGHTSNSQPGIFSTQPSSLSPATACVLQSSSLNTGEQRESQLPCERAARTDHSRGPTPRCPSAESEGEEECESVQNWIMCRAAQQLSASLL